MTKRTIWVICPHISSDADTAAGAGADTRFVFQPSFTNRRTSPSGGVRKPRCEEDRRLSPARKIGVCSEGQRQGSESDPPRLARRTEHSRLWCAARQPFAHIAHQPSLSGSGTPAPVRPSACVLHSTRRYPAFACGGFAVSGFWSAGLKACLGRAIAYNQFGSRRDAEKKGEAQRCCGLRRMACFKPSGIRRMPQKA